MPYPVTAIDNALRVLDLVATRGSVRVADVADELEVAPSTAHRLLGTLLARGFVRQHEPTRRYEVGHALLALTDQLAAHRSIVEIARPSLVAAARDLGETVHLGVLDGADVRYLDAIESPRAVRVAARTGRSLPAHWTSIGKVLLADLGEEDLRRRVGHGPLSAGTDRSITDLDALVDDLTLSRARGFAINVGESEDDVTSVAIAVADPHGATIAGLGCAAPVHRLQPSDAPEVAARLRAAVHEAADLRVRAR
jgi:DNA-binding IclR family transcriptional regulator